MLLINLKSYLNNFNKYIIESGSTREIVFKPLNLSHLSSKYLNWMNDKEVIKFRIRR